MKVRSLALVLAVVLCATQAFGQDLLRTGIDAYRRGDYPEALRIFRALAQQGNANGQNTLVSCTAGALASLPTLRKR